MKTKRHFVYATCEYSDIIKFDDEKKHKIKTPLTKINCVQLFPLEKADDLSFPVGSVYSQMPTRGSVFEVILPKNLEYKYCAYGIKRIYCQCKKCNSPQITGQKR